MRIGRVQKPGLLLDMTVGSQRFPVPVLSKTLPVPDAGLPVISNTLPVPRITGRGHAKPLETLYEFPSKSPEKCQ